MAKDIKEKIYELLKENSPKRFNSKQIEKELNISYPSILKWVEVLIAEKRDPPIKLENYGNMKLVWIEK